MTRWVTGMFERFFFLAGDGRVKCWRGRWRGCIFVVSFECGGLFLPGAWKGAEFWLATVMACRGLRRGYRQKGGIFLWRGVGNGVPYKNPYQLSPCGECECDEFAITSEQLRTRRVVVMYVGMSSCGSICLVWVVMVILLQIISTFFCSCSVELPNLHWKPHGIRGALWGSSAISLAEGTSRGSKINFGGNNYFWGTSSLMRSWDASQDNSNTQKWGTSWGARREAPHKYAWFCMMFWGASHSSHPLQEPQTRPKMRCLMTVSRDVASVMPCLGITSLWGNYSPNCPSLVFSKKGPHFKVCSREPSSKSGRDM